MEKRRDRENRCTVCGSRYYGTRGFCSTKCITKSKMKICAYCKKQFSPVKLTACFCSTLCRTKTKRTSMEKIKTIRVCKFCDQEFIQVKNIIAYCSAECAYQARLRTARECSVNRYRYKSDVYQRMLLHKSIECPFYSNRLPPEITQNMYLDGLS